MKKQKDKKTHKIKIAGLDYTIKIVEPYDDNLLIDHTYRAGVVHKLEETIYLADNLNKEILERVFIHELVHVFVYASGMGQVDWEEENVADFIEARLYDIYNVLQDVNINKMIRG